MKIAKSIVSGVLALGVVVGGQTFAAEHVVKAAGPKFDPMVVKAAVGDTIKFSNMGGHDTVSIAGLIPEGAAGWKSEMGKDISVTLDKEGVYIYKCSPHAGAGMVGAVIAGSPKNLDAVKASPENKGMIGRAVKAVEGAK